MRPSVRRPLAVVAAGAALLLVGCSSAAQGPQQVLAEVNARAEAAAGASAAAAAAPPAQVQAAPENCSPGAQVSYRPLASLPGPGAMPSGTLERTIADRGYLVVGVSGDTRLLGARNQLDGGALEGFDIDIARSVAKAIFGDGNRIRFKVITAAERIKLVQAGGDNGGVDLVARAMTMTCDRWKDVAFSASYFAATQLMLAPKNTDASTAALAKAKARVCAPSGSTSLAKIQQIAGIRPVAVEIHSDCLALLQEGRVDAITGDDAILAGFADQDPRVTIGTEQLGAQPYGLAMSKDHPEFVAFVNAVLASPAGREAWTKAYAGSGLQRWLGARTAPAPQYGR